MSEEETKQEKTAPSRKVCLHRVEIPEDMKRDAILFADNTMDVHDIEKDVATHIKKHFDTEYGGTWHCIVGANYGSSVTHETNDKPTTNSAPAGTA